MSLLETEMCSQVSSVESSCFRTKLFLAVTIEYRNTPEDYISSVVVHSFHMLTTAANHAKVSATLPVCVQRHWIRRRLAACWAGTLDVVTTTSATRPSACDWTTTRWRHSSTSGTCWRHCWHSRTRYGGSTSPSTDSPTSTRYVGVTDGLPIAGLIGWPLTGWWHGVIGVVVSVVRYMSEVNARQARLVPGWETVFGRVYHLGM